MLNAGCLRSIVVLSLGTALGLWGGVVPFAQAGEITLKNGTRLQGKIATLQSLNPSPQKAGKEEVTITPIVMVATELQRYFVPYRQVPPENVNRDAELSKFESFTLPQQKKGTSKAIQSLGSYLALTPFDAFGRRTVTMQTSAGPENIIQGITKITPQYIKIAAVKDYLWETGIATSSVPPENLDNMLRQATKANDPDHRLAIARFYLQAEMYRQAQDELASIHTDFPELAGVVQQVSLSLLQLQAQQLLGEFKLRQNAGQHRFVYESLKQFPTENVAAPILREVREMIAQYEGRREQAEQAVIQLGELQAALSSKTQAAEVAPLRSEIVEKLNYQNMERLDAFLKLSKDPKLPAADKLALALSGWVVGSANAVTDLDLALRLWKVRFLVLNYLRTPADGANERKDLLGRLLAVEGIGVARIPQMLALLPTVIESGDVQPGEVRSIQVPAQADKPAVEYSVLLPLEYHPDHLYPLIIALHAQGRPVSQELDFWGGAVEGPAQSQRHGYIVIAPEYAAPNQRTYDYSATAHYAVLESLRDARRRFNIDSDRVFLSGHAMGGDAALDIGLSHPDLFAGVIPITAVFDKFSKIYWENAKNLPLYFVAGELDRTTAEKNSGFLTDMMKRGYDLIYTEFIGAGQESFYAEIHKLFAWMSRQKRVKFPRDIEARTRRATDNRFHWMEVNGLPAGVTAIDWTSDQRKPIRPLTAKVTPGNTLNVSSAGAATTTLWLSPDFIDFEKRLAVQVNGARKWNNFLKPDFEAMLEDVRRRGDRQQIYWAVLEF